MLSKNKYRKYWLSLIAGFFISHSAVATEKSASLVLDERKATFYSANFDAGSVSKLSRTDGKILVESTIGRDIRRIALSSDETMLMATDYLGDKVILMEANTLKVKREVSVPSRPFGVVYHPLHQLFYVTSFEQDKLLLINHSGEIVQTLPTETSPRGLAFAANNRLLITHAMTGQVSLYDISELEPKLIKVIQLADSAAHSTKTVSQGKPRLLDNIVVSPDGLTAWLPHVLWSFAHDFQFQSSVFPAISILDLELGNEHEVVQERKELFKQINVIESGNRTRIVSNPHDGAYSEDGMKVIFTMAGSEDLLVFDLSRQGSKNSQRHRRKSVQGGVKATQVYRGVPGNNPRGLVITKRDLFVQNAMSLDMAQFDIGEPGPFAKVKLTKAGFASLVNHDPVPKQMRLGKTLFNSANTADNPEFPMAGDFWMSCNSCHLDGFNFTNRQLMEDGKKDRFENALTGHVDVRKMIAGDPVGAYIDIIQKTQGGLGGDPRDDAPPAVDVENPPLEVAKMMTALNEYVRAQENLPYLATWLRLDDKKRYTHPSEWINSAECAECHTTIYQQWADSNHGMNMDHPYYRQHEDVAAKAEGEEFRVLCRGCHAPQSVINQDNKPFNDYGDMYEQGGKSLLDAFAHGQAVNERGTGCVFCHRVTKAENAGGNTDMTVNLKDRESYLFEDANNSMLKWLAEKQINAAPEKHKASYSNPELYQSSLYCATCHNEFTTGQGANINDNFGEWLASPFNSPDDPSQHKTCIDCHMTQNVTDFNNKVAGQSTDNGPIKQNMRSHHFVGGNYFFTGMRNPEHKQLSIDILKTALTLKVERKGNALLAHVTNANSGHDMPGGARRQVWLEVIATDASGKQVFESGVMQEGYIPADARKFIKVGVDKEGKPVGQLFWRYVKIGKDTRIKSGETRTEAFELPADVRYPLTVSTRVLYQVFAKGLSDKVRLAFPEENIPEPEVIELQKVVVEYDAP